MTTRTLLSGFLLTGLVAMAPAIAQDAPPEPTPPPPGADLVADVAVAGQGEVEIGNTLAQALVDTGAAADFDTALGTVQDLRAEGMGWGQVAQELGFNLGHEVSAVRSDGRAAAARATDELAVAADGDIAPVAVESRGRTGAGADTAASARLQSQVGRDIAADARVNARIDAGVRTDVGRPLGVGAPVRPERPLRVERPARGGR